MQRTHFQSWQMGKKSWIVVTNFSCFLRKIVRCHDNFSASYSFHPAQNGKIFQHKLIHFIHTNAMYPFLNWQTGKSHEKSLQIFIVLRKIVRRHNNFSASYSFHPAQNGKIFQHRLIDFIHTNAMNPFSKLTIGEEVLKNRYKLLIHFAKNCASPWQLLSVIFIPSGSEGKEFSTQTDWFYSCQCNEPIFKVDNWGKSHQ